jgi:hypothetical protein
MLTRPNTFRFTEFRRITRVGAVLFSSTFNEILQLKALAVRLEILNSDFGFIPTMHSHFHADN